MAAAANGHRPVALIITKRPGPGDLSDGKLKAPSGSGKGSDNGSPGRLVGPTGASPGRRRLEKIREETNPGPPLRPYFPERRHDQTKVGGGVGAYKQRGSGTCLLLSAFSVVLPQQPGFRRWRTDFQRPYPKIVEGTCENGSSSNSPRSVCEASASVFPHVAGT